MSRQQLNCVSMVGFVLLLFVTPSVRAQQIVDNETVSIIDFFEAFPGYDVENVLDTGDDRYLSDYASRGGGVDTYIEFDLGAAYDLTEIIMTDRVTSGGGNFTWVGGLFDYNRQYAYTLSVDSNFANGDGVTDDIVIEVEPEEPEFGPVAEDELELLQSSASIPSFSARYVRWEILDTAGANPGANDFEFVYGGGGGGLTGDFNGNGVYDAGDIDELSAAVRGGANPGQFDLNFDGLVNSDDRGEWVDVIAKTYLGDSNLDGEFNSGDFVFVFGAGQYEDGVASNSTWATGDWNGDTEFDSGDFVAAFAAGGYETGPRAATAAVPEPSSILMVLVALCGLTAARSR